MTECLIQNLYLIALDSGKIFGIQSRLREYFWYYTADGIDKLLKDGCSG